ncbi:MAG: hypothetical protein COU11_01490 [Candidatus Harrisonbacteria bacterium CG10_big_fil_rev_8_21_14_0_10_49_15]|uniref:Cohesin domain-containing protein n=1 Tax=Candidatus Harrisonbacteria bacterium CG10_big_fil_rev_8_21_14_0_10_49_15 TaxID=1974587 RepID=A0A2H0ULC6_9BACT|nr:MAG: hypothetical protein COU11_01490 [Candidatus Harrisonbacteria bacterium CG10_big_fil_rev_8_21_14_0_10_49_15]
MTFIHCLKIENCKLKILLAILLVFSFSILASPYFALAQNTGAQLYLTLNYFQAVEAEDFSVTILLDTPVAVNAYNITFQYPTNILKLTRVDTSHSLITVMPGEIEQLPDGRITIRGGSAEAFNGQSGEIAVLHFKPIATGAGNMGFVSAVIHEANGQGTPLVPTAYQTPIQINSLAQKEAGSQKIEDRTVPLNTEPKRSDPNFKDTTPPLITLMQITTNPLESGKLLIFEAIDEQSGVSHFLLRERRWIFMGNYQRVFNPHSIASGSWAVELTAVDRFGNEDTMTIYQWGGFIWKIIFALILLTGIWLAKRMYATWLKHQQDNNS